MKMMKMRSLVSVGLMAAAAGAHPVALSAAAVLAGACGHAAAQPVTVLPPHSHVPGGSIADYSTKWWRWALGFTAPNDPISDPTGALAGMGQSGPVFYLGGSGTSQRSFSVPSCTYVLVPLLNGELSQLELPGQTGAQVREAAIEQADLIDVLYAEIDGMPVPNLFQHRELSRDFRFKAAPGNPIGVPAGQSGVAVADGYYLMLAPLPPGQHTIHFGGGITQFGYFVDTTDTITVGPCEDD